MKESQIQAAVTPCGTARNGKPLYDLSRMRFGRLTVIKRAPKGRNGHARWLSACDCGGTAISCCADLRSGHTTSCGCVKIEQSSANGRANATHGHTRQRSRTPEYVAWSCMHGRCRIPSTKSFEHYGGRGISVCDRWSSFGYFLSDMGTKPSPRHSIDRINPDGDYSPDNCRWATPEQQQANRRTKRS